MKVWKTEMLIVACALMSTNIAVSQSLVEFVGGLAVLATFGHIQVASRLHEQALDFARSEGTTSFVDCSYMFNRYLVAKELLWVSYFILHESWSALVGCGLFLAYPIWRRIRRGELGW